MLNSQDKFDGEIDQYLSLWHHKFDIFCEEHPFFQVPGLVTPKISSVKKLAHDCATGNNKTLFSHHFDAEYFSFSPADAACHLITSQYFSLGGGISVKSNLGNHSNFLNSPLIGGHFIFIEGKNIFQTLINQMSPYDSSNSANDTPVWERDFKHRNSREPLGLIDRLTWPSRYIRLIKDQDGSVSKCHFTQGVRLESEDKEPFFSYYLSPNDQKYYPMKIDKIKPMFFFACNYFGRDDTDIPALHIRRWINTKNLPVSLRVLGLDSEKAKIIRWYNEQLNWVL